VGWCDKRKINPFSPGINDVGNFLAQGHSDGLAYKTINTYRSCLSTSLPPIEGSDVGKHPLIVRLMRGIGLINPPKPRYGHTWNVKVVTDYIEGLNDNDKLSLRDLSYKLIILLLLSSGRRSCEITSLDLRYMIRKPEGTLFSIPILTKTQKGNSRPKEVLFPYFPLNKKLCVVSCLTEYIERTGPLRSDQRLLISYRKPFKHVSSASVARWTKSILSDAGIDTSKFKAHSTRGASTTAAKENGVPLDCILDAADWSSEFSRFYYRPASTTFGRGALGIQGIYFEVTL